MASPNLDRTHPGLIAATALVYLFLLGPLIIVFGAAFSGTTYLAFPPQGLSLRWFENALSNTAFRASFATSMQVAFGGTGLALLFGVPAAYAMSRYRVQLPKALGVMFILPILIPEIVAGF